MVSKAKLEKYREAAKTLAENPSVNTKRESEDFFLDILRLSDVLLKEARIIAKERGVPLHTIQPRVIQSVIITHPLLNED